MPRRVVAEQVQNTDVPGESPEQLVQQVRRLLAEAQALSARLAALNEVAVAIQSSLDADAVLTTLEREARWVLDFQYCSVAILEGTVYYERILKPSGGTDQERRQPIMHGMIGQALGRGQAILRPMLNPDEGGPPGMHSAMIVPLRTRGDVIGSLNFFARAANRYTLDDLRIASALAVQVAAVFQNARLFTAVTETRDELTTVLESISDGVLVYDTAGRILLVNTALRTILNLHGCVLTGRRALILAQLGTANGQRLIPTQTLRKLFTTARTETRGTLDLTDGRHLEWTRVPLSGTGTTLGFVITLRDISARIELDKLRNDMIGMLVHDLRTPLTSVIMGLELLQYYKKSGDDESYREVLEQANGGAHRLLRQINAILDVRQLEAGRLVLQHEQCSLEELMQRVCASLTPLAQSAQLTMTYVETEQIPFVEIDRGLIERVLENLIGNALKFTPPHGRITLRAELVEADGFVEVSVEDTGPGIPEALRTYIFEMYGQVAGAQQRKGTGIGLTFCRLVIEAHHGQIGVRPAPGGGSIFWFRIPLG